METLADPYGDRVVTDFPPPPVHPLSEVIIYPNSGSLINFFNSKLLICAKLLLDFIYLNQKRDFMLSVFT